jgi:glycosyltransferase involved in cell wall biosynthesis
MTLKNPVSPLISVILAVYNGEKEISESIFSILHQTFKQFELIVIDDCSTDNTYKLLQSIHDPRIKLIQNDTNLGLAKSLNKAIKKASGQFIARQDSGDVSFPDRFEKQIAILQSNSNIGLIGLYLYSRDNNNKIRSKQHKNQKRITQKESICSRLSNVQERIIPKSRRV